MATLSDSMVTVVTEHFSNAVEQYYDDIYAFIMAAAGLLDRIKERNIPGELAEYEKMLANTEMVSESQLTALFRFSFNDMISRTGIERDEVCPRGTFSRNFIILILREANLEFDVQQDNMTTLFARRAKELYKYPVSTFESVKYSPRYSLATAQDRFRTMQSGSYGPLIVSDLIDFSTESVTDKLEESCVNAAQFKRDLELPSRSFAHLLHRIGGPAPPPPEISPPATMPSLRTERRAHSKLMSHTEMVGHVCNIADDYLWRLLTKAQCYGKLKAWLEAPAVRRLFKSLIELGVHKCRMNLSRYTLSEYLREDAPCTVRIMQSFMWEGNAHHIKTLVIGLIDHSLYSDNINYENLSIMFRDLSKTMDMFYVHYPDGESPVIRNVTRRTVPK